MLGNRTRDMVQLLRRCFQIGFRDKKEMVLHGHLVVRVCSQNSIWHVGKSPALAAIRIG